MQNDSLIETKFHRPTLHPHLLPRLHLIERLENGRFRKLTLISAPAGYGKSVLAGIWQETCDCPVAWLSLDKHDNDLGTFLNYVVHAVHTILPNTFENTKALLNGLQLPPLELLTASLLNETAVLSQPFLLILDDFHLIHNQEIHQIISSLIQYQPPHLHLALLTRQDPPLDIINLRARNEVTEIRLTDLRFSAAEAQQYLNKHLGNELPSELAHQLFQRTEGWAVGLRLAILALHNQGDQARIMEMIQGSNQYIMSYLVSEVLSQQPQPIQRFLLVTSLLDRFCAPLCDALLSSESFAEEISSQEIFERLCQKNLFLFPLDYHNEWFRYHQLFQDLLRHELKTAVNDTQIHQLHAKASAWFAQQGAIEEALDHAFLARDPELAVQIVAQIRYKLINETQWQRLQQLLSRFPRDVIESSLDLLLIETWLFYHHGQNSKLPTTLEHLNERIQNATLSPEKKSHILGEINALYSLVFYYGMDIDNTCIHAEQAIEQLAPELSIVRIFARLFLAGAQQMSGNINDAYTTVYSSFDVEPVQSDLLRATALVTICYIDWQSANLLNLRQNATQALHLCSYDQSTGICGYAHYHVGAAAYYQNDLTNAQQHFAFVNQRPGATYHDSYVYSACGLALIYQALGQEQQARDTIEAALTFLLQTGNVQLLMVIKAFQAELACQQGHLNTAVKWANQFDTIPALSPMPYLYAPHFTLVKIWLSENTAESLKKASDLLTQIKLFLESTHNDFYLIETLALQAIVYQVEKNKAQAMATLEQALILALPSRIIRPFVNLGQRIGNLLFNLPVVEPELAAFKAHILEIIAPLTNQPNALLDNDNDAQLLVDPLTERELDILILLDQRQTNREIAQTFQISPHTVHTHVKHIFTKLDVNSRRQAAIRAQELGLIPAE